MKYILSILLFLSLIPASLAQENIHIHNNQILGQDMITKSWFTYKYKGESYKRGELGQILNKSEESLHLYTTGIDKINTSRKLGRYGLLLMATGYGISYVALLDKSGDSPNWGGAFLGFIVSVSGATLNLVGLFKYISGKKTIKQSINHFNWEVNKGLIYKEHEPYFKISTTGQNIGITYVF